MNYQKFICHSVKSAIFTYYIFKWYIFQFTGLENKIFESKIVNIFLPNILTYALGAQKNHLIEMILLSTTTCVLVEKYEIYFLGTHS